jgi:endoglucanase
MDNRSGAFIVAEVLRRVAKRNPKVGVYCASTMSEEVGLLGAYDAGAGVNPNIAIACDVTFATDHPGVDTHKHGEVSLGEGPALSIGPAVNSKVNVLIEKAAARLEMKLQYEIYTRTTGTDADRIKYTGKGVPITCVSLPLRYMHAPVETASFKDIEEEIELLAEFAAGLTGEESLKPVEL